MGRSFNLEQLQEVAEIKGGKLLSKEYKNSTTFLLWQCKLGHKFQATALEIMGKKSSSGKWCPKCSSNSSLSLSLEDIDLE